MLDFSKLKEFADDNFEFDENGRKFSEWVENTAGKAEIACYEQFLLFPQCFRNQGLCAKELIGSTSFSFAQTTIHDFQNTTLNS